MADDEALIAIRAADPQAWVAYRDDFYFRVIDHNPLMVGPFRETNEGTMRLIDLSDTDLSTLTKDLSKYDLSLVCFDRTNLTSLVMKDCNFTNSTFNDSIINDTKFDLSNFDHVHLMRCTSNENTSFRKIRSKRAVINSYFEGVCFKKAILKHADITSSFINCNLAGCNFRGSRISNTTWQNSLIDKNTSVEICDFSDQPVTRDKSDSIRHSWFLRKWLFNWRITRIAGSLPIFEFSWVLFLSALFIINTIGLINTTTPKIFENINQIPIPQKMEFIILSTLLLSFGSTLYKIFCPDKVKEFSAAQWVYEHRHPRVEYLIESLQKPIIQAISILSLLVGAGIGSYLLLEKVLSAISYIF